MSVSLPEASSTLAESDMILIRLPKPGPAGNRKSSAAVVDENRKHTISLRRLENRRPAPLKLPKLLHCGGGDDERSPHPGSLAGKRSKGKRFFLVS